MTAPYDVAEPAVGDMDEIWDYYEAVAGVEVANRLVTRIESRFPLIAENPYIGVARPEYGVGIRTYHPPGLPYIIAYTISGDIVRITRVVDGRRNLRRLFG